MPELLIELFCEDIPARMQRDAAYAFGGLVAGALEQLGLMIPPPPSDLPPGVTFPQPPNTVIFWGPRRIGLATKPDALASHVAAVGSVERGPRISAPEAAIAGFLRKHGAERNALRKDGDYWVLEKTSAPITASELIGRALPQILHKLPWPKSMRWGGGGDFTFVRPLRRILCLFDGAVVALDGAPAGLLAGNLTEGHRFLAPAAFAVDSFAHYRRRLREASVVVDAADRRQLIRDGAGAAAQAAGLALVEDEALLDEVSGLVEWPCPLLGRIDDAFMDLPAEVLRTSMRVNQRYFATVHPDGRPAPHFVVIANIPGSDGGAAIIAGNERVLRARFSDARFFWDSDRKRPLEAYLPKLESVVFHAKLGTQAQRVARLEALAEKIAPLVGADPAQARRAARLAKADLATGMVGEFPELQGVMGSYYARAAEGDAVADAIRDHYAPRGPNDAVPTAPVTIAVALADKLDQLAGFFVVGEKPTGSGDPFGLRRAALGVIRLVRENGLRLDLRRLLDGAAGAEVLDFLAERLRVQLRAEGRRHDILAAILARGTDPDLVRLLARTAALEAMLGTEDGKNLLAGYRRAANILRIEERRDSRIFPATVEESRLADPAERALDRALAAAEASIGPALEAENFTAAMAAMAGLRHPIDKFFEQVTVNAPEKSLRENRLNLLARLRATFDQVADFSKIEG